MQANGRQDSGTEVTVQFEDHTTATADLVVGCDGIHSTIRSQFVADNPQYSGRIAWRGLVPIADVEAWWPCESYSASWLGIDKHLLAFPISQNKILNIVAFVTADESTLGDLREGWTATGDRDDLAADFANFNPAVRRIIDLMPQNPTKWKLHYRDLLDEWVFFGGKVVLMGDAAHAV
jgi:salicylate hydroxylase